MDGYRDPIAMEQAQHHQSAGRVELGDEGDHILQVSCSCFCMSSWMVPRQDHVLQMCFCMQVQLVAKQDDILLVKLPAVLHVCTSLWPV